MYITVKLIKRYTSQFLVLLLSAVRAAAVGRCYLAVSPGHNRLRISCLNDASAGKMLRLVTSCDQHDLCVRFEVLAFLKIKISWV